MSLRAAFVLGAETVSRFAALLPALGLLGSGVVVLGAAVLVWALLRAKQKPSAADHAENASQPQLAPTAARRKSTAEQPVGNNQPAHLTTPKSPQKTLYPSGPVANGQPPNSLLKRPVVRPTVKPSAAGPPPIVILETTPTLHYIGYPLAVAAAFEQLGPLSFPYVVLPPRTGRVVKLPQPGRSGRRGHTEAVFLGHLQWYFGAAFSVSDNQQLLVMGAARAYAPDFTLRDEQSGLNLLLDVEIDEPYAGTDNPATRVPLHYQGADTNRNNAFRNRGWVVVRFAEIQVHRQPNACCRFLAEVVASLLPTFSVPAALAAGPPLLSLPQWTRAQAEAWAAAHYRETYLGLGPEGFGKTADTPWFPAVEEDALGKLAENLVRDEPLLPTAGAITARTSVPLTGTEQMPATAQLKQLPPPITATAEENAAKAAETTDTNPEADATDVVQVVAMAAKWGVSVAEATGRLNSIPAGQDRAALARSAAGLGEWLGGVKLGSYTDVFDGGKLKTFATSATKDLPASEQKIGGRYMKDATGREVKMYNKFMGLALDSSLTGIETLTVGGKESIFFTDVNFGILAKPDVNQPKESYNGGEPRHPIKHELIKGA